tara:strand:+ start:564 stop:2630 length:2067 start_codon:yes stop_codon:yes gene_type:complete
MADKKIALDLEVNIKKGDITLDELNNQFKQIGETIQEQKDILIEFQQELIEVERIQASTSSTNFQRQGELKTKSEQLKFAIKDQRVSLRELNNERAKASGSLKAVSKENVQYNKLIQAGDKLTGGKVTKIIKLSKGFKEGVKGIKAFNMGLSGMKKALIATGIGALVVALGVIVAYWDDIVGFINGASAEQNKLLEDTEKTKKANEDSLAATEASENSLKLQGMSEKEILELKKKQTDEIISATEAQLQQQKAMRDSQIAAAERNQKIAAGIIGFLSAPIVVLLNAVDALTYGLSKVSSVEATSLSGDFVMGAAAMIGFDPDEVKKEGDATVKETEKQLAALKNKRDGFELKGQADDKKAADKSKQKKEKEAEEEKRLAKEKADALEAIRVGEIDTDAERRQEELDKIDKYYEDLITKAEKYGQDTAELEDARDAKKQEIFDKQAERDAKEQAKKDKKTLKEQEELITSLEADKEQEELTFEEQREDIARREAIFLEDKTLTETQRNEVEANFTKERKDLAKGEAEARMELNAQRVDLAMNTLGALNGLVQAFAKDDEASQKKAFNANKAFGIAQAVISTAQGISAQLAVPQDALTGANFIKAGIVAATGAAQIATIAKTQFKGSATPPTAPPPPADGEGSVGFEPRGFIGSPFGGGQPTTKVIVTETDIRSVTGNVSGIYNKAVVVE